VHRRGAEDAESNRQIGNDNGNDSKDTAQAKACTPNEGNAEACTANNDHGPATAQGHGTRRDHGSRDPSASGGMAANNAAMAPGPILAAKSAPGDRLLVLIGPEGGFSDAEREAMRRGGFVSVSLGPTVLRTETAAIVAAGCLLAAGDLAGMSDGGAA
jgi:hypothetical protein